jgi:hypothetical protein
MAATVVAGFLTTTNAMLFPAEWRPYLPFAIAGIIMVKQLAYGVLDLLDDGKLNKSYKTPTTLLKVLLPVMLLSACVSDTSTDKELGYAKTSLEAAALAYDLAALSYTARATDPKVSPYEKLLAERAFKAAADRLAEERAKVQAILDRRRAEAAAGIPLAGTP